jgi:NAD(P)H-quinone oxidoreductase subunit 5
MLFPLLILLLFTLFIGSIGIHFDNGVKDNRILELTILSKWLTLSINLFQENSNSSINSNEFLTNAISSLSLAIFGLFIAYIFYGSAYSFFRI